MRIIFFKKYSTASYNTNLRCFWVMHSNKQYFISYKYIFFNAQFYHYYHLKKLCQLSKRKIPKCFIFSTSILMWPLSYISFIKGKALFFLRFFFFGFLGLHSGHMEVPRPGLIQRYSCQPTVPQAQQCRIQASSLVSVHML